METSSRVRVELVVGEEVYYPMQGIGKLVRIEDQRVEGADRRLYVFEIEGTGRNIIADASTAAKLRKIPSGEEVREIFDILRERGEALDDAAWTTRFGELGGLAKGGFYDVAQVVRDLNRLATDKQLNFKERRLLESATVTLVTDIALARRKARDGKPTESADVEIRAEIRSIFMAD